MSITSTTRHNVSYDIVDTDYHNFSSTYISFTVIKGIFACMNNIAPEKQKEPYDADLPRKKMQ